MGKKRKRTIYSFNTCYPIGKYDICEMDKVAIKIAGREETASGGGFGVRDLVFAFRSERKAEEVRTKFLKDKRFKTDHLMATD